MKKGFTLMELIAVIVILALVAIIVFPNINAIIFSSRQTLHDNQIIDIEKSSEKWATDNIDLLDHTHANMIYLPLEVMKGMGYLEKEGIIDPLTKKDMAGCIQIKYDVKAKKYSHIYQEKTCEEYASTEDDQTLGYIIYEYDAAQKKIGISDHSHEVVSTGKYIYDWYAKNDLIYSDGEEANGLYELEDQYVFRGKEPDLDYCKANADLSSCVYNYVELAGKVWRILSIDKKDYSMKLIAVSSLSNQFDQGQTLQFENATSNVDILKKETIDRTKILERNFETDIVDGTPISRRALKSTLGKNIANLEIGLISVMDYVNASATLDCTNNYLSASCSMNNYLAQMFGNTNSTWTINHNGSQVWYIDTDGMLKLENPMNIKQLYPVIYVSSNTYIVNNNATGSITSPYKIK